MNVSARPSGDRAGCVAESVKFVICCHSVTGGITGLRQWNSAQPPAAKSDAASASAAYGVHARLRGGVGKTAGAAETARPESVSRLMRLRSASKSEAV